EADPYAAIDLDNCRCLHTHSIDMWAQNFLWLSVARRVRLPRGKTGTNQPIRRATENHLHRQPSSKRRRMMPKLWIRTKSREDKAAFIWAESEKYALQMREEVGAIYEVPVDTRGPARVRNWGDISSKRFEEEDMRF